ncbi:hypothetical protein CGC49_04810 [Capnocytophaga sp. H4358]|nr:hypothetical protein CGC49_04810 [Capnocytophaga sp. H4358]
MCTFDKNGKLCLLSKYFTYQAKDGYKVIRLDYKEKRLKSKIVGNKTDELFYKQVIQAIKQDYKMLLKK